MRLLTCLLGYLAVTLSSPASSPSAPAEPECVVLLHGAGARGIVMKRVESNLRRAGYRTVNITYPSRKFGIDALARDFLPKKLQSAGVDRAPRVHFVTHSMGGLVLRAYLGQHKPANLGRVVMIVPPNQGTIAADNAGKNFFLKRFFGPALPQMGTGPDAWHRHLGPVDFSPGVIAGRGVINPLYTKKFGGPNDGIVAVESARVEGMGDFIVLPYSHTMILFRRETSRLVLAFLRAGRFAPPPR